MQKRAISDSSIERQLDLAQRLLNQQHPASSQGGNSLTVPKPRQQTFTKPQDPRRAELDKFHAGILALRLDSMEGRLSAGREGNSTPSSATKPNPNGQKTANLPTCFQSHLDYMQLFSPLVLEEIRAELQGARTEADEARVGQLTDLSAPDEQFQYFTLQVPIAAQSRNRDHGAREFETQDCLLVELTKFRWVPPSKATQPTASSPRAAGAASKKPASPRATAGKWVATGAGMEVLAIVVSVSFGGASAERTATVRAKCRASVDLAGKAKGWRDSSATRRLQFKVTKLRNVGVSIREWRSIRAIEHNRALVGRVLRPPRGGADVHVERVLGKLNPEVRRHLEAKSNESQIAAIAAACDEQAAAGFTLLQGPPGTGKTSVIVSILNFLHLTAYQRHYDAMIQQIRHKVLGEHHTAEELPAGSGTLGAVLSQMGQQSQRASPLHTKLPDKPRILVCAPSNAAVDHLVERVLTEGLRDATRSYTPDMIRVGNPHACSHRIRVVTLDHQVDEVVQGQPRDVEEVKGRYRAAMQRREQVEQEFRGFPDEAMHGELIRTQVELDTAKRELARLELIQRGNGRREEVKEMLRTSILEEAQVVFTTLNSAGSDFFSKMKVGFKAVIIDEACQAVEASTLIPLSVGPQSSATRCIMVGDPRQLPATVISQSQGSAIYQRSLFERLESCGHAVHVLDTQYRMHPEIRRFPSDYFYQGTLKDGPNVAGRDQPYHDDPWVGALAFIDLPDSRQSRGDGSSLRNREEASVVGDVVSMLFDRYSQGGELRGRVAVLTPYRQQRHEIVGVLRRRMGDRAVASDEGGVRHVRTDSSVDAQIDVMTVDACQGQERDVIVFSCVRASEGGVGFLNDVRRMNVALTRAKHSLIVIGNSSALISSPPWRAFLHSVQKRNSIVVLPARQRPPNFRNPPPRTPENYLAGLDQPPQPDLQQLSRDRARALPLPDPTRPLDSGVEDGKVRDPARPSAMGSTTDRVQREARDGRGGAVDVRRAVKPLPAVSCSSGVGSDVVLVGSPSPHGAREDTAKNKVRRHAGASMNGDVGKRQDGERGLGAGLASRNEREGERVGRLSHAAASEVVRRSKEGEGRAERGGMASDGVEHKGKAQRVAAGLGRGLGAERGHGREGTGAETGKRKEGGRGLGDAGRSSKAAKLNGGLSAPRDDGHDRGLGGAGGAGKSGAGLDVSSKPGSHSGPAHKSAGLVMRERRHPIVEGQFKKAGRVQGLGGGRLGMGGKRPEGGQRTKERASDSGGTVIEIDD